VRTHLHNLQKAAFALVMAVALSAAAFISTAPAAHAACASAEVQWSWNDTSAYLVGPKQCIVNTPWNEQDGYRQWDNLRVGPVGAGYQIWVPLPPF
jgi:hypothetical protein